MRGGQHSKAHRDTRQEKQRRDERRGSTQKRKLVASTAAGAARE
jgi:hypothetical protein